MRLILLLFAISTFASYAQSPQSGWVIEYPTDAFTEDALLDLRYLNENVAGENGFIKLSTDGKDFRTTNANKPIRFWAVGGGDLVRDLSDADLSRYARYLAKMGVNIIRFHGAIHPKGATSNMNDVDMNEADAIWRTVAAMKKEGIYTAISPYWAGHVKKIPATWGLGEYTGADDPWALIFFNDNLKNAYKHWVDVLYTTENPYTGIALKDDPSVALIQIQNEDGLLFWTVQGVKPNLNTTMEEHFYTWLVNKYGTIEQAFTAWSNVTIAGDNTAAGRVALYIIWEATQQQTGGKAVRVSDQVEFLTEHQRNFYTEIYDHYKSLGCKQLINAGNWRPADATLLFDAERYSNATNDVMAVNRYVDPQHVGENNGWRIDPGHHYVGKSVLVEPQKLPINIKQLDNKPFIVTESAWNLPHKYQSEGPFLIAAYMSLTGVDGYFWFSPSAPGMDPFPYYDFTNLEGGQKAMYRWTVSTPGQIGMFPANALLYRKGYVKQSEVVVHEERPLSTLWKREVPLISEESGFDPNRDEWGSGGNNNETEIPPIAHLIGTIEVKYDGNPVNNIISPKVDSNIDFVNKITESATGELKWDYKKGICTMNTPSAKGVSGFLGVTKTFTLDGLTITSENDYATINVVSMDDNIISESEKILIQVGTTFRPTNWSETPAKFMLNGTEVDGFKINNTGKMPWRAGETNVNIAFTNAMIKSAHVLDVNGYNKKELFVNRNGNQLSVTLPRDAMYVILNTEEPKVVVGLEEDLKRKFKLYPNPSNGNFIIDVPEWFSSGHVEIKNTIGETIWVNENISPGKNEIILAASPGVYLFSINKKNQRLTQKVILK